MTIVYNGPRRLYIYFYFFFLLVYHDYFFIIDIISTLGGRLYHGRGSVRVDTRIHLFLFL